jgi:DNA-binding response OmpR family regulator
MRILYAEDEKSISDAVKYVLEHNNYTIDVVDNGEDALDYIEYGDYDVAILDIMMPKVDGITVLKQIREKGNDIPILLLTAKSDVDDRVEGLNIGADDYLCKPFAMKELLARVLALSRRNDKQKQALSSIISFGNISLDCSKFIITSSKGSEELPNKEYQIFEMLISHPKQIISIEQFLDKIWGYNADVNESSIWVYISYLRKKLSNLDANIQIKSNRNRGYSLVSL